MNNNLTPEIYDASKSPDVRALRAMAPNDLDGRSAAAAALLKKGVILDREIDVWGFHPGLVMRSRLQLGCLFWPNFSQAMPTNVVNQPGSSVQPNYDLSKNFPGAIESSTDAADYPAFNPTPALPAAPSVGPYIGNGIWGADLSVVCPHGVWAFREGDPIQHSGLKNGPAWTGTLYFHIGSNIMGAAPEWLEAKP